MKLSIDGRFRKAASAAFVSGLAAAAMPAFAQEAAVAPAPAAPAETMPAEPAAVAAVPAEAAVAAPAAETAAPADALPVLAVESSAPVVNNAEQSVKLEKVEVTGSRIRRVDAETAQPLVTIDRAAIQASGVTTVGDLLQELPSIAGAATNPRVNNGGGDGASAVSLRGLGTDRTLILLNGRRLVQQDVNSIPLNLVQRVDVLKEGASAIYGSDAIGGVVNFITRKDFKNLEVGVDYGVSGQGDGPRKGVGLSWGTSSEKANIMIGLNYNQQDAVSAADRGFSKFATYLSSGSVIQAGSSRNPRGRITLPNDTANQTRYNCFPDAETQPATLTVSRIEGRDGSSPDDFQCYSAARDAYNFQAVGNVVLTPQERAGLFTVASYAFSDSVEGYTEFFVNSTRSSFIIAPLPFDARSDDIVVSADNAFNPFGMDFGGNDAVNPNLLSRFTSLGNRSASFQTNVGQLNLGLRGDFAAVPLVENLLPGWSWDAGFSYGRIEQTADRVGYIFGPALQAAVGPSFTRADGSFGCGTSAETEISGCTPINIFNLTDPAQIASLQSVAANAGSTATRTLKSFTFNLTGDVAQLPAGPLGMAVGGEHRIEEVSNDIDFLARSLPPEFNSCYLSQETCSNPTVGDGSVTEFYGEALVPVLSNMPYAKQLNLIAGVRFSEYASFGTTTNAKLSMEYRPVDDLLVRAGYAQVFRAPTISNQFTPPSISNPQFADPCEGTTQAVGVDANFDRVCENVPRDGSYSAATSQVSATVRGNPDLKPERGNVFTYGFVYDVGLEQLKGLSLSVDFWRYRIDDTIVGVSPNTVANQCLTTGNDAFCNLIERAPDGQVLDIGLPTLNLGKVDTEGVDTSIKYRSPKFEFGRINAGLDFTYLNKYDRTVDPLFPESVVGNAGRYNDQDGNFSRLRGVGNVGWSNAGFEVNVGTRYIGEFQIGESDLTKSASADGAIPGVTLQFGDTWYYDATVAYKYKPTNTKFLIGVDNLSDEQPPLQYANNALNANTDVSTFDTVGRYFFFKLTQTF